MLNAVGTEPVQGIAPMLQVRLTSDPTCFTFRAGTVLDINQNFREDE